MCFIMQELSVGGRIFILYITSSTSRKARRLYSSTVAGGWRASVDLASYETGAGGAGLFLLLTWQSNESVGYTFFCM